MIGIISHSQDYAGRNAGCIFDKDTCLLTISGAGEWDSIIIQM